MDCQLCPIAMELLIFVFQLLVNLILIIMVMAFCSYENFQFDRALSLPDSNYIPLDTADFR